MGLQIVFCLEADNKSQSDWVYVYETVKKYYIVSNEIKISRTFLGGKGNYKNKRIVNQIEKLSKAFKKNGQTVVVYFIDTDDINTNQDRQREFKDIQSYCDSKGFELVWFCRDIEEVYWGGKVEKGEKTKVLARYRNNKCIDSVDEKLLKSAQIHNKRSNILSVLDKYLSRK